MRHNPSTRHHRICGISTSIVISYHSAEAAASAHSICAFSCSRDNRSRGPGAAATGEGGGTHNTAAAGGSRATIGAVSATTQRAQGPEITPGSHGMRRVTRTCTSQVPFAIDATCNASKEAVRQCCTTHEHDARRIACAPGSSGRAPGPPAGYCH